MKVSSWSRLTSFAVAVSWAVPGVAWAQATPDVPPGTEPDAAATAAEGESGDAVPVTEPEVSAAEARWTPDEPESPADSGESPAPAAQSEPEEDVAGTPTFGGFSYGAAGVVLGRVTGASPHLQRALGDDGAPGNVGWQLGGGGKMLLWGLVIGGKGFYLTYPETSTSDGSANLRGGGGGLDFGFAAINRSDRIVCPFVGIGGIGLGLSVTNISDQALDFGSERIAAGEEATFGGGFWYVEAGLGAYRFTTPHGGPALGVEFGVMASLGSPGWNNEDGAEVDGVAGPKFAGAYLKVAGGGGGFFLKK